LLEIEKKKIEERNKKLMSKLEKEE